MYIVNKFADKGPRWDKCSSCSHRGKNQAFKKGDYPKMLCFQGSMVHFSKLLQIKKKNYTKSNFPSFCTETESTGKSSTTVILNLKAWVMVFLFTYSTCVGYRGMMSNLFVQNCSGKSCNKMNIQSLICQTIFWPTYIWACYSLLMSSEA